MSEPRPPGRLRRWLRRGLIALACLVLLRFALPFTIPFFLQSWARERGLELTYEDLNIGVLDGSVELWHANLRPLPAEGEERSEHPDPESSLAHLEFLEFDAVLYALLLGKLRATRVELDGMDVLARRGEDGVWELQQYLVPRDGQALEVELPQPEEDEEEPAEGPLAALAPLLRLARALEVSAVRVQHLNVRVQDPTVEPAVDTRLEVSVRLSDVGSRRRRTRLQVVALAPGVLNAARVEGNAAVVEDALAIQLEVEVDGLHARALGGYLRPLGLEARARQVSFGAKTSLRLADARDPEAEEDVSLRLTGDLEVRDVALSADLEPTLTLERLAVDLAALEPGLVHVAAVELEGLRGRARRDADGVLSAAGLGLVGAPPAAAAPAPPPAPPARRGPRAPLPALLLDRVTGTDFELALDDRAVVPATELAYRLDELSITDVVLDPARPGERLALSVESSLPGVARSVRVDGGVVPTGPLREASFELAVEGIAPEALAPYLAQAGLTSAFEDGSFHARLDASLAEADDGALVASVGVRDVALVDGDELLAVDEVAARDVRLAAGELRVSEVAVSAPRLRVDRLAEGPWRALGVRTLDPGERERWARTQATAPAPPSAVGAAPAAPRTAGPADSPGAPGADPADAGTPTAAPPLRLVLDRLALEGARLALRDRHLEPALELEVAPAFARLEGLVLGGPTGGQAPPPARLEAGLVAAGLAEELGVRGTLATRPGPLDVAASLALRGRGLTLRAVEPYLAQVGVESLLDGATLDGDLEASARQDGDALAADAALRNVRFENGGEELAGLDAFALAGLRVAPGEITLAEVVVDRPRLDLARDADGALRALGLRVLPRAADAEVPAEPVAPPPPAEAPPAPAEEPGAPAALPRVALGSLRLNEAALGWSDAAVEPPAATALRASASVDDVVLGPADAPARVAARVSLDGLLEELDVAAEARLDPADLRLALNVAGRGLRADPVVGYFPPGLFSTLTDGRLGVALEARSAAVAEGGRSAFLEVRGLDYREAEADEPFLAMESFTLDAPRLDPAAGVVELARLTNAGLALAARRTGPRRVELLGLALEPPPAFPASSEAPPPPAAEPEAPAEPAAPRGDAARTPGEPAVHSVTLGELDLGIARLAFRDETDPAARPLEVSARLATPGPQVVVDADPAELPPLRLVASAAAAPLMRAATVDVEVAPWAPDPELAVAVAVEGLRGAGVAEVVPELGQFLGAGSLDDGTFGAQLRTTLQVRRRSPTELDLSSGFGLAAELADVALRATPEGEVLAGVDAVHVDVTAIRPRTGDVHVRSVAVERPAGRVRRTAEGVEVLGLLFRVPELVEAATAEAPAEGEPAEEPAPPVEAAASSGDDEVAEAEEPRAADAPEFRVDELLVSGIDFELRDDSVEPPLVLPFDDLDVEVKRFTTRALVEPRPIQFQAVVAGGDVELAERDEAALLAGMASAVAGALGGADDEYATELRPAFEEVVVSGRLTLAPVPRGWTKLSVAALELPNFRGVANEIGVDLGDGLMDTSATVRLLGDRGLRLRSDTTFAYLSVSEAPDGPISQYLKLPAPLDVVLFVLRNKDGEHRIPVRLTLPEGEVELGAVSAAAAATVGKVVGDALAGTPFRMLGSVTDLVGLTGGEEEDPTATVAGELAFLPGAAAVPVDARDELAPLVREMNDDGDLVVVVRHAFGRADVEQAERLANPSEEDSRALAARLRGKRTDLSRRRDQLAAEARARYAVGLGDRAREDSSRLRDLDAEIGRTEEALDRVYELLRPGAERRRDRRTRAAALTLGELRLEEVRDLLERVGIRNARARVDLRRPRYEVDEELDGGRVTLTLQRRR